MSRSSLRPSTGQIYRPPLVKAGFAAPNEEMPIVSKTTSKAVLSFQRVFGLVVVDVICPQIPQQLCVSSGTCAGGDVRPQAPLQVARRLCPAHPNHPRSARVHLGLNLCDTGQEMPGGHRAIKKCRGFLISPRCRAFSAGCHSGRYRCMSRWHRTAARLRQRQHRQY